MKTKEHLIVALDKVDKKRALQLAEELSDYVWGFKLNDLLIREGVKIISEMSTFTNIFADPKLYDIPNTVANSVKVLEDSGAKIITLHASGGEEMLNAAREASSSSKLLAVTLLTSFSPEAIQDIYQDSFDNTLERFVNLATKCKMDGIVCSGNELNTICSLTPKDFIKLTPGIRPESRGNSEKTYKDDQKRVMSPSEAISQGSSFLVIGRPILESKCPASTVKEINQSLENL